MPRGHVFYNRTTSMRKKLFLFLADTMAFWLAFCLMLAVRWGTALTLGFVLANLVPFFGLWLMWCLIAYSMQLYSRAVFGSRKYDWIVAGIVALFVLLGTASMLFYFYGRAPNQEISPRGSLLLFWVLFGILFMALRSIAEPILAKRMTERVLVVGSAPELNELASFLKTHNEYGFMAFAIASAPQSATALARLIKEENVETVVSTDALFPHDLYPALPSLASLNVNFSDPASFYENKIGKIYLDSVSNIWALTSIVRHMSPMFSLSKETGEKLVALIAGIGLSPLFLLIALLIKLTSRGPVLYAQTRVGLHEKPFLLYKFRTMNQNAESTGPQWAQEHDPRVTPFGRVLRASHLDELPQLLNIIRGELSFVGPRPERPEFVQELTKAIPFYALRHIVPPGITGWAQINYPYGASIQDAKEKLQYDLYYLKHRSLALDLSIVLKTIRRFFQNPQHSGA